MSMICPEAISRRSSTTQQRLQVPNPVLTEKIARAALDNNLYESDTEPRPSADVLKRAIRMLSKVPRGFLRHMEIYPYFGEINVTWRNERKNGRVKASFGPEANSSKLYWEQMTDGRVSSHNLLPDITENDLVTWLRWLYSA